MKTKHLLISFTLGLSLALGLLWLLGGSPDVAQAQSGTGIIRVDIATGVDAPGCGSVVTPCQTVQYGVDQALQGEEIRVAAGNYTDIHNRPVPAGYPNQPASGLIIQVVYISKTVTIRGGYTTADWNTSDPEANHTTLDAQGQGRVLVIAGTISPMVEGLRITDGDAAGLGGLLGNDAGGGVYVISATATVRSNQVFNNDALIGGGLYLHYSDATLTGNTVTSNTAVAGGGLELWYSDAMLTGNTVVSNTAYQGGGLSLWSSNATLSGNTVVSNTAGTWGGGLYLYGGDAMLINNVVADNQANTAGSGLYIEWFSSPRLLHTTIARNSGGDGSGVHVTFGSTVALTNTILVSHTVGITVTAGSTATLESTLWHANGTDSSGNVIRTNDYTGDPAFAADGYHIGVGSAALDEGINAGVTTDIDGDPRPLGPGYDLGADEWEPPSVPVGGTTLVRPFDPFWPYGVYLRLVLRSY